MKKDRFKDDIKYPTAEEANEASRMSEMKRIFEKAGEAIGQGKYTIEVSSHEVTPFIQKELESRKYQLSELLTSGFINIYWTHETIKGKLNE